MSVEMLPSEERVEITSARVFELGGDPAGQWLHIVDYVDLDGNVDGDSDFVVMEEARARANVLSKRFGCPILDCAENDEASA